MSVWRCTVEQYHQMIATGILTEDDPVELIHGLIVAKMPENPPHKKAVPLTQIALTKALPLGFYLIVQQPVAAPESEPEPDVGVVRGNPRDYPDGTPGAADVGLLVEVSDSSLLQDRDIKGPLYAAASYPIYWIINLLEAKVEVYTDPSGPQQNPAYRQRQDFGANDSVPLVLDGAEVGRVPVKELLP